MHTDTEHLKTLVLDIASRQNPETIQEPKADHRLLLEANRLEKAITQHLRSIDNFTQRDTFHNDVLGKLIDIVDILYEGHGRKTADVIVLLELLTNIRKILPKEISPLLRLPKGFVHEQKEVVQRQLAHYIGIFKKYDIAKDLIPIASIPFLRFTEAKEKLFWGDFTWLKGYMAKLDAVDWEHADCNSSTEALMSLLIGRDFNHEQFYVYCKKYITARVAKIHNRTKRLQEYALCEKLVLEDTQINLPSFNRYDNSISPRLLKLIKDETDAFKLAVTIDDAPHKVEFLWDSDTTAVFYKYLMDKGITKKVDKKVYAKQISATVSTVGKDDVQWDTFHKRFYNRDEKYLSKIFGPLNSIVEDIKFFLGRKNT